MGHKKKNKDKQLEHLVEPRPDSEVEVTPPQPGLMITRAWRAASKTSKRVYFTVGEDGQRLNVESNTAFGRRLVKEFGL